MSAERTTPEPGSIKDHVILLGPPGAGMVSWARRARERFFYAEWAKRQGDSDWIHTVAGLGQHLTERRASDGWARCPLRAPHHSVSETGFTGSVFKGWRLRPGELSLAHGGVLLLDTVHEFSAAALGRVLEALRTGVVPLKFESGLVRVPAEFRLIATGYVCPCGWLGTERTPCRCSATSIERWAKRFEALSKYCRFIPEHEWRADLDAAAREDTEPHDPVATEAARQTRLATAFALGVARAAVAWHAGAPLAEIVRELAHLAHGTDEERAILAGAEAHDFFRMFGPSELFGAMRERYWVSHDRFCETLERVVPQ